MEASMTGRKWWGRKLKFCATSLVYFVLFFFQAEDGIRDLTVTGVQTCALPIYGDERGFFQETYRRDRFEELGVREDWVQDNHSRSRLGVVRGMHFQAGQAKLVRCRSEERRVGKECRSRWSPYH